MGIGSESVTWTRSRVASSACFSASSIGTIPTWLPSASISRTSVASIFSLIGALGARPPRFARCLIIRSPFWFYLCARRRLQAAFQNRRPTWFPGLRPYVSGRQRRCSRFLYRQQQPDREPYLAHAPC